MRRRWIILVSAGLLYLGAINATNEPPAYVYRGWTNQLWVALGLHLFSYPCVETVRDEDGTYTEGVLPTDQCYRMSPPQLMRGVWIDEFEGSQFLPGAQDAAQAEVGLGSISLDVETNRIPGLFEQSYTGGAEELRAFQIDFIGRKTAFKGQYGHLGGSDYLIIVDRLISARPVDVTPYARKVEACWEQQRSEAQRQHR